MPHEKRQLAIGEIYHVTTRRIGNELLFGDINDYYRGIFSIYEFNNANPVDVWKRRKERAQWKKIVKEGLPFLKLEEGQTFPAGPFVPIQEPDRRKKLVEILAFCLMPNHIHLLLREIIKNGISKFMQKFGGYATYFKEKYQILRKGHFFQDRYYPVHIKNNEQLKTAFVYDHINPISIIEPNWKEQGIKDLEKAIRFLEEEYRWSSYWDYLGKTNFPSVTTRDFLLEVMGGPEYCQKFVNDWIRHKGKIGEFQDFAFG